MTGDGRNICVLVEKKKTRRKTEIRCAFGPKPEMRDSMADPVAFYRRRSKCL